MSADVRGKGLTDLLMQEALAERAAQDVVLSAQTPLAAWYSSLGFEVTGPEYLDDGIPHVPMRRRQL